VSVSPFYYVKGMDIDIFLHPAISRDFHTMMSYPPGALPDASKRPRIREVQFIRKLYFSIVFIIAQYP